MCCDIAACFVTTDSALGHLALRNDFYSLGSPIKAGIVASIMAGMVSDMVQCTAGTRYDAL